MIDRPGFEEYSRHFDKELILEIIDIFIREYPDRIEAMQNSVGELDLKNLAEQSHLMKGAISNFMAPVPFSLIRKIEELARCGEPGELPQLFIELKSVLEELISELKVLRLEFLS